MKARWLSLLVFALVGCEARVDTCARARRAAVVVYTGSRLLPSDGVVPGRVAACSADTPAVAGLVTALERVPADIVDRVVVHVEPQIVAGARAVKRVEYHRPSGAILVAASDFEPGTTVWLHEVAHVVAAGAAPKDRTARRLYRAMQEAFADYFAAVLSGSSRVGSEQEGELRQLEREPAPTASAWSALALPGPFAAHRFGVALAGLWWRKSSAGAGLLSDLRRCFTASEPWPAGVATPAATLREFTRRCPAGSQPAIRETLGQWLPKELYEG